MSVIAAQAPPNNALRDRVRTTSTAVNTPAAYMRVRWLSRAGCVSDGLHSAERRPHAARARRAAETATSRRPSRSRFRAASVIPQPSSSTRALQSHADGLYPPPLAARAKTNTNASENASMSGHRSRAAADWKRPTTRPRDGGTSAVCSSAVRASVTGSRGPSSVGSPVWRRTGLRRALGNMEVQLIAPARWPGITEQLARGQERPELQPAQLDLREGRPGCAQQRLYLVEVLTQVSLMMLPHRTALGAGSESLQQLIRLKGLNP